MLKNLTASLLLFLLLFLHDKNLFAQELTKKADSLEKELLRLNTPATKAKLLNEYAYELLNFNPEKTETYAEEAKQIAQEKNLYLEVCNSYVNIGFANFIRGIYNRSLDNFISAYSLSEKNNFQKCRGDAQLGIGLVYLEQSNFPEAYKKFNEALKTYTKIRYQKGVGHAYNMIGLYYYRNNKFDDAEIFFDSTLKVSERVKDDALETSILQDIANLLSKKEEYNFAIQYHNEALTIANRLNSNYHKSLSYNGIGFCYFNQEKFTLAETAFNNAYKFAQASDLKPFLATATFGMMNIEEKKGNYKKAYELYEQYFKLKEFLSGKETSNKISEISYQFQSESKNKQIELLNKEKLIQKNQLARDKMERVFLILAVILIAVMILLILNRYRVKDAAHRELGLKNEEIASQRDEIESKNQLLELKNKDMTDSIQYALQIQKSLLPEVEEIKSFFNDAFCLYLPKDIVSGDFYWVSKKENKIYLAVGDCTGHGIPGAFMSILGISSLNEVLESNTNVPLSKIAEMLDATIVKSLKQKKDAIFTSDGMDLSLCCWDSETRVLEFCGLKRPLIYFKLGACREIKGGIFSVGGVDEEEKIFVTEQVKLSAGDTFYMFTDGYADQFGGTNRKKMMTKSLKNLLIEINSLPLSTQHKILQESFENWKMGTHQTDDVLIIGVKV